MMAFIDLITAFAITYNATPGKHHTFEKLTGVVSNSVVSKRTYESFEAGSFSVTSFLVISDYCFGGSIIDAKI
mgnify:FL=1